MLTGEAQAQHLSLFDEFEKLLGAFARKAYEHYQKYGKNGLDAFLDSQTFVQISYLTKQRLLKAIDAGYTGEITEEEDQKAIVSLQNSVRVFSGFKTYQTLKQATDLLLDAKGKIKSFGAYSQDIKAINQAYNDYYLQVEYNQAIASAQMARIWNDALKEQDLYDLQYDAVNDERTRASHKVLDGIIRPVQDPIWRTMLPVNDWGCRCTVRKVRKTNQPYKPLPANFEDIKASIPEMFRTNTAQEGIIFPAKHPYYQENEANRQDNIKRIQALMERVE